jgi:hypothetical protein
MGRRRFGPRCWQKSTKIHSQIGSNNIMNSKLKKIQGHLETTHPGWVRGPNQDQGLLWGIIIWYNLTPLIRTLLHYRTWIQVPLKSPPRIRQVPRRKGKWTPTYRTMTLSPKGHSKRSSVKSSKITQSLRVISLKTHLSSSKSTKESQL